MYFVCKICLRCRHWRLQKHLMQEWRDMYWWSEQLYMQMCYRIHGCRLWNKYVRTSMKQKWNHKNNYIWVYRIELSSNVDCYCNVAFLYPINNCGQCTEHVSSRRLSCVKGDCCHAVVACDIIGKYWFLVILTYFSSSEPYWFCVQV